MPCLISTGSESPGELDWVKANLGNTVKSLSSVLCFIPTGLLTISQIGQTPLLPPDFEPGRHTSPCSRTHHLWNLEQTNLSKLHFPYLWNWILLPTSQDFLGSSKLMHVKYLAQKVSKSYFIDHLLTQFSHYGMLLIQNTAFSFKTQFK